MPNLQVTWGTLTTGGWCPLINTNFSNVDGNGVYYIWAGQCSIKVGQSKDREGLGNRLAAHARDTSITAYQQQFGTLYVTWANLPPQYLDGVERFLGDHYRPIIGDRFPNAVPISVNLP